MMDCKIKIIWIQMPLQRGAFACRVLRLRLKMIVEFIKLLLV